MVVSVVEKALASGFQARPSPLLHRTRVFSQENNTRSRLVKTKMVKSLDSVESLEVWTEKAGPISHRNNLFYSLVDCSQGLNHLFEIC